MKYRQVMSVRGEEGVLCGDSLPERQPMPRIHPEMPSASFFHGVSDNNKHLPSPNQSLFPVWVLPGFHFWALVGPCWTLLGFAGKSLLPPHLFVVGGCFCPGCLWWFFQG